MEKRGVRGGFEPAENRLGLESSNLACLPAIVRLYLQSSTYLYQTYKFTLSLVVEIALAALGKESEPQV